MSNSDIDRIQVQSLYGDRMVSCYAHRPLNLDAMFRDSVRRRGVAPALEEGERRLSYAELNRSVDCVASGFRSLGVRSGERVALFLGNRIEYVVALLALWRLGAVAVPIGIRQARSELEYVLNQCGAMAIVMEQSLTACLPERQRIPTIQCVIYCADHYDELSAQGEEAILTFKMLLESVFDDSLQLSPIDDQQPACIMYTSGTTGHPKGAVLSHLGFYHTARNYILHFGYRETDRLLLVIPGSHISGLAAVIMVALQVGGCLVMMREFKCTQVLDAIQGRRISAAVMVPAMYTLITMDNDISHRDLTAWRIGHFGGAAMPEVTIQRLASTIPTLKLYNGFGATETTAAVTLTRTGDAERYPDSVGTLLPCVDIQILDDNGVEMLPGEAGELWIRSPGNAITYWNNLEESRNSFIDGYWRSGDIGSIDTQGYLRVFDRIKDMINRGGFKVYCVELENVIQRYPGVIEVAVVPAPCDVLGERIHVFVHTHEDVQLQALREFCKQHIAEYKMPDFLTLSEQPLPRNLNGKIIKAPLRKRAAERLPSRNS